MKRGRRLNTCGGLDAHGQSPDAVNLNTRGLTLARLAIIGAGSARQAMPPAAAAGARRRPALLPRAAMLSVAAAAVVAAAAAAAAAGAEGPHPDSWWPQPQLLPQADATGYRVAGQIDGPHHATVTFSVGMPDLRTLISTANFNPGGERTVTGYSGGSGRTEVRSHSITFGGDPIPSSASGSMVVHAGRVLLGCTGWSCSYERIPRTPVVLADGQRPYLDASVAATLDLSGGTLAFRATEDLRTSVFHAPRPERIAMLHGAGYLSADSGVAVSGRDVTVTLTAADHERLDVRMAGRTSTGMKVYDGNRLYDAAGNEFTTGRWWQGVTVVRDTAPPVLARNPQLDFNTGVLTVTFDERVTWLYLPYLYLEDRNGGSRQHLSGASVPSPLDHAAVPVTLSAAQLERLAAMHLASGGLRLDMHYGITADVAGNRLAAVSNRAIDVTRDTTAPALAAGSAPVVDLARQTVSLAFNERMDASETAPGSVRLIGPSGSVSLAGEAVSSGDGRTVTLTLSNYKKALVADLGTPLKAAFDAGAFKDVWGNRIAATASAGVAATVRADTSRPGAWGASSLDMNDGVLTVGFTDVVYTDRVWPSGFALHVANPSSPGRATTVPLAGATVSALGTYADSVDMLLTGAQKAAVASAGGPSPSVRMTIGGWAFQDYPAGNRGWYVTGAGFAVPVDDDTTRPVNATAPLLDADAGTITMGFDEYIDASAFRPQGMALVRGSGSTIPIGGAVLSPAADGDTVTLNLTDADAAAAWNASAAGPVGLTVPGTSFYDMSGNAFAGLAAGAPVAVAGGAGAPALDGTPLLDLGNGTLWLAFDGNVTVPSDLSGIAVAGLDGNVSVRLAGATAVGAGGLSDGVYAALTPLQKALLAAEYTYGGALAVNIAHGAIVGANGRSFDGISNGTLAVVADTAPPVLVAGPTASLIARTISMTFDEYIDLDSVDPAGISVVQGVGGADGTLTTLSGAAVSSPDGSGYGAELVVTMTPAQNALVFRTAFRGVHLSIDISGFAVRDASGNALGSPGGAGTGQPRASDSVGPGPGLPLPAKGPGPGLPLPAKGPGPGLPGGGPWDGAPPQRQQPLGQGFFIFTPPQLASVPSPVRLDLNTGVLEIEFMDLVSRSDTNLTGAVLRGAGIVVSLEGADVLAADPDFNLNETVIVALTAAQKAGAVAAGPTPLLDMPAGFATQVLKSLAMLGERIAVTPDSTAPMLNGTRTVLDLGAGTLAVSYDEYVAAPPGGLDAGSLAVVTAGGGRVSLEGARAVSAVNDTVAVSLSPQQKAVLDAAARGAGAASMRLAAEGGAVHDLSGNAAGRSAGAGISVLLDAAGPELAGTPILNLGTGTLTLSFD